MADALEQTMRFLIELEVEDNENARYAINKYLDHGTFQDGLSDAGVNVTSALVLADRQPEAVLEIRAAFDAGHYRLDSDAHTAVRVLLNQLAQECVYAERELELPSLIAD